MPELNAVESHLVKGGEVTTYRPQNNVSLTVAGGATPSNESDPIRIEDAEALALTVFNGASTNLDVLPYASLDGVNFDTEPYTGNINIGANKKKTVPISPGPRFIKIKVENKDTGNATTVTTYLNKYSSH